MGLHDLGSDLPEAAALRDVLNSVPAATCYSCLGFGHVKLCKGAVFLPAHDNCLALTTSAFLVPKGDAVTRSLMNRMSDI